MIEHSFSVRKTARWFATAEVTERTKDVWIVMHGYGQLAERFLKKFEPASDPNTVWMAPEGLHRFYTDSAHHRVGASWMTRESRQTDIDDNLSYLNEWIRQLRLLPHVRIHLLGFSQGAATAVRWFCASDVVFRSLTLWAGSFPPDVSIGFHSNKFKTIAVLVVAGQSDEIVSLEKMQLVFGALKAEGVNVSLLEYEGGHNIYTEVVVRLKSRLTG